MQPAELRVQGHVTTVHVQARGVVMVVVASLEHVTFLSPNAVCQRAPQATNAWMREMNQPMRRGVKIIHRGIVRASLPPTSCPPFKQNKRTRKREKFGLVC